MSAPRVLVIDDEEDFHDILAQCLRREGFAVEHAFDGAAGLAAIARARPDAVVLDLSMPVLDGFEVCRRIRADPLLRGLPVVMLTVRGADRDVVAGLDAGADGYMAKPVDPPALARRLRALIEEA